MFSNRDIKRVRAELLRDAECPEDDPYPVRARLDDVVVVARRDDIPPVLVRQLATTGTPPPSPPRPLSPVGRSLLPRLDKPTYREDLSIFNWRTREEHEEIVRRFRESNDESCPVPVTRQNAIHPPEAQSSVAVDMPLTVRRTTSRWSDSPVRTSDMDTA